MRFITTILLFCSLAATAQLHINSGGVPVGINTGGTALTINPFFRPGVMMDDGYYNGFPMVSDVVGKETFGVYKKSSSHAASGPLMLLHTTDFGRYWTEDTIYVDGSAITSSNHSFAWTSTGRLLISYKVSSTMYFAYNDNGDRNFTSTGTPISPATDYDVKQSPVKMVETSYGTIIFAYYQVGSNGNPNSAVLMESADNGLTWAQKSVVYTYNNVATAGAPYWRGNEIAICETHPTGSEETSKWIAFVRTEVANDGGTYFMKFNSADGGNTWTQDATQDAGTLTNEYGGTTTGNFYRGLFYRFIPSNAPCDIRLVDGLVYVVYGDRYISANPYALKYTTATPDDAYENIFSSWDTPTIIKTYYADEAGSTLDCGYPLIFTSGNQIFVSQYDVSTGTPAGGVTRRCLIETVKIK